MIDEILSHVDVQRVFEVLAIAATGFTLVGSLAGVFGKAYSVLRLILGHTQRPTSSILVSYRSAAEDGVVARLAEAKDALRQQYSLAKAHRIGGGSLTFGQFIVGGLLASSFVQDHTSKTLIGVLGLLVLASSIIRQHYKPESSSIAARERAVKLKSIIREVEDQIYYQKEGVDGAVPLPELRATLTRALNDLDTAEALALAKAPSQTPQQPPSPPADSA